jgi:hypothetical protein
MRDAAITQIHNTSDTSTGSGQVIRTPMNLAALPSDTPDIF